MPPKEETQRLLRETSSALTESSDGVLLLPMTHSSPPLSRIGSSREGEEEEEESKYQCPVVWSCSVTMVVGYAVAFFMGYIFVVARSRHTTTTTMPPPPTTTTATSPSRPPLPSGPYQLFQLQNAHSFLDHYEFYEGEDSVGSAGYNTYVTKATAVAHKLVEASKPQHSEEDGTTTKSSFVIRSAPGGPDGTGPRQSVRLEGTTRFNAGLFIVEMKHMPAGCGVWPAVWLTDEQFWPNHGEIDFIEGVNYQNSVKTALHTNDFCDMYGHVDITKQMTGTWDRATGIPNTYTGILDTNTSVPADNCSVSAPHQWANQGCVIESQRPGTLGPELNAAGGAVFVLEWDPRFAIRSWVFVNGVDELPDNLAAVLGNGNDDRNHNNKNNVAPEPDTWGVPYAYFAIGDGSGCSADHFVDMRLVINTAFCGTVAGNRFFTDCHVAPKPGSRNNDPIAACNAYMATDPPEMEEAYWEFNAIRVYQRSDT
jgi:Glycosyl hydrolases family 16